MWVETIGSSSWVGGVGEGSDIEELELCIGAGGFGMVPDIDSIGDECGELVVGAAKGGEGG